MFFNPPSMPDAIRKYCNDTDQPVPQSHADFVRCILESLALKYRVTLDQLRQLTPRPLSRIHVIGGGAQNGLLCQFTANATGLPVLVGPIEATATGNVMVQALAAGDVRSLAEMRNVVRNSFRPVSYEPCDVEEWESVYLRYRKITSIG
jgi:rhamnulokinase